MNLQGKTALITGASRGIGKAVANELASQGIQRLLLVARDRKKLAEVATEITAKGVEVITLAIDLTKPKEIRIAIAKIENSYGAIDILINCAGVVHQAPFL